MFFFHFKLVDIKNFLMELSLIYPFVILINNDYVLLPFQVPPLGCLFWNGESSTELWENSLFIMKIVIYRTMVRLFYFVYGVYYIETNVYLALCFIPGVQRSLPTLWMIDLALWGFTMIFLRMKISIFQSRMQMMPLLKFLKTTRMVGQKINLKLLPLPGRKQYSTSLRVALMMLFPEILRDILSLAISTLPRAEGEALLQICSFFENSFRVC